MNMTCQCENFNEICYERVKISQRCQLKETGKLKLGSGFVCIVCEGKTESHHFDWFSRML